MNRPSFIPPSPLLLKELRVRMRARTVVITGNLYIAALCVVVLFSVFVIGNLGDALAWEIGSSLYRFLVHTQGILMLFVAPLVAAAAIAEEKEQKTYDTLRMTSATPSQIATAKLAAALGCFLMLIMVSLPIASISFILGGVAPGDLVKAYAYTILATLTAGAMGLYWSARFDRTIASIPAASICVVLVLIAAPVLTETGATAIATVSPIFFLGNALDEGTVPFFGNPCPAWVPSFLFLAFSFAACVTAVSVRLRFDRDRRYVLLRTFALILFFLAVLFLVAGQAEPAARPADARRTIASVLGLLMAVLFAAAPWLGANRPVAGSERGSRSGVAVRRLRALMVSGPGFALLLWAATLPALWLALRTVGETRLPEANVWRVHVGITAPALLVWSLLSAILAGRTTTLRRFVGMSTAYVLMFVFCVIPIIVASVVQVAGRAEIPLWTQWFLLLSPAAPIGCLADPRESQEMLKTVLATLGPDAPFAVTGTLYLVLALFLTVLWRWRNPGSSMPHDDRPAT